MITIKLVDARRGLHEKCKELFSDRRIADQIYEYLCDGIEECECAEPERPKGRWILTEKGAVATAYQCSICGRSIINDTGYDVYKDYPYCHCGAAMTEKQND